MKIAVISDTHDNIANVHAAARICEDNGVQNLLHAGDLTSAQTAARIASINNVTFIGVMGNCDQRKIDIAQQVQTFGGQIHEYSFEGELQNRQIFMTHIPVGIDQLADSQKYDLIIHGHTHKYYVNKRKRTIVVNPGDSAAVIINLNDMSFEKIPFSTVYGTI